MLILDLFLILATTILILANHDVPNAFYDAIIGVSFAIAGITHV